MFRVQLFCAATLAKLHSATRLAGSAAKYTAVALALASNPVIFCFVLVFFSFIDLIG